MPFHAPNPQLLVLSEIKVWSMRLGLEPRVFPLLSTALASGFPLHRSCRTVRAGTTLARKRGVEYGLYWSVSLPRAVAIHPFTDTPSASYPAGLVPRLAVDTGFWALKDRETVILCGGWFVFVSTPLKSGHKVLMTPNVFAILQF